MLDPANDVEKASDNKETIVQVVEEHSPHHDVDDVPRDRGVFRKLWKLLDRLDGVETRGIERVPPDDRNHTHRLSDCVWMWFGANTTIATFALGTLGSSVFGLNFRPATFTIIFFNLISTIPVAYFSTFGPKLGLRQMTLSRFSFALYFPNWIPVILNLVACLGWSTVKCIAGALTLSAAKFPKIPSTAGVIIIAISSLVPSFIGYRYVFAFERYTWIPNAVMFFLIFGLCGQYFDFSSSGDASTSVTVASVLSFGSAVCGFGLGWSSLAADYTVNYPEDVSSIRLFIWNYIGLNVPLILVEILGAAMMTTLKSSAPKFAEGYASGSIGGLLGAALTPLGLPGQLGLPILASGVIANNILNMYSLALTTQALHPWLQSIPRPFICVIGTVVSIVLAVTGINHFASWLNVFLDLLGYVLAIYCTIVIEEHLIFRRGKWSNYDPENIADPKHLPVGIAATVALIAGVIGTVLGMSQEWYIGVLAKQIEPNTGGDTGFELAAAFTGVVYPIARHFEKKRFGR